MNKVVLISFGLCLLFSCQKELEKGAYLAYVTNPNNGLRKDREIKQFKLSAMYEPAEFILAQDDGDLDEEWKNGLRKYEHFQFKLENLKGGDILEFNQSNSTNAQTRINHFGFEVKNDFTLIVAGDSSKCKMAHFSRNYNLSPTIDLSLTFDKQKKDEDWQLVYRDSQYNLGIVKFLFKKSDLLNIPALKK